MEYFLFGAYLLIAALAVIGYRKINIVSAVQDADYDELTEDVRTNRQSIDEATEVALRLDIAREKEINTLRKETPTYEINEKNEAVIRTRDGKQIYNYDLKKNQS